MIQRTPLSRRTLLLAALALPSVSVLAACGDPDTEPVADPPATVPATQPPTTGPASDPGPIIEHPTGADDLVVEVRYEGGFVPVDVVFTNLPTRLITGDGRSFEQAVTTMQYPGPLVQTMVVRPISEDGIQTVLQLAAELGLLAPAPDYADPHQLVADAPDTVVVINAQGETYTHRAYALGLTGEPGAPETEPSRRALQQFVDAVSGLSGLVDPSELGPEAMFEPAQYRFRATAVTEDQITGGELEPTIVEWPADVDIDLATATECAVASADVLGPLVAAADVNTFFRRGEQLWRLAVAPVLPGEEPCAAG